MTDSYIPVTELFKQFCKERHTEDKGKNYDKLQEIYANTELFDLSFLPKDKTPDLSMFNVPNHVYEGDRMEELIFTSDAFKNIALPFESQFVKLGTTTHTEQLCVYLREFAPFIITGTTYLTCKNYTLNVPCRIDTEKSEFRVNLTGIYDYCYMLRNAGMTEDNVNKSVEGILELVLGFFMYTVNTICNLPKHSVACDKTSKTEYFRRHRASTIKVCKPIYYVLDKKEEQEKRAYSRIKPIGSITFDHSFKVRGHWRRIDHNTLGKNRNNEYVCRGITWVKEHVRGEGELLKKVRVVK